MCEIWFLANNHSLFIRTILIALIVYSLILTILNHACDAMLLRLRCSPLLLNDDHPRVDYLELLLILVIILRLLIFIVRVALQDGLFGKVIQFLQLFSRQILTAASDSPHRILSTHLHSDGDLWDLFHVEAGGSTMEVTPERYAQNLHKMRMKGKEIFKVAVRTLADFAVRALEENKMSISDLDWFVPHQANIRIIEAVANRLEVPMDKVIINVDQCGNTSAGTIPTALDEAVRDGRIKKGDIILLDAFGAGLTYGSSLLRW